jgi:hypothetical protein
MNLALYTHARKVASKVVPTCTDKELTRRAEMAQQAMATFEEDSDGWTVASAAFDAFESELERRHPMPEDDPICICGVYRSEHQLCGCGEWERAR